MLNSKWVVPCPGEGDAKGCDHCWKASNDATPYCATEEYKRLNVGNERKSGRRWLSWCGKWESINWKERVKGYAKIDEYH